MATDTAAGPSSPPVSPHSPSTTQQLSDLPLNKLTHSTTTLPSTLTVTSTGPFHKRVLADRLDRDRLDKLQRICTGGAEGQPGVLSQVGFEPTLHQYSNSLPSAPSPSSSNAAPRSAPSVTIPTSSTASLAALSPISASADSARLFQTPTDVTLQRYTSNTQSALPLTDSNRLPQSPALSAIAEVMDDSLQPPKRRSTSFLPPPRTTSSSSFNFQPLAPSPSSAFAAPTTPPIAESEHPDVDSAPTTAAQRNTLLHYWTAANQPAANNTQQQQLDDTADIQIIDNTDTTTSTNTDKKLKPLTPASSTSTANRRTNDTNNKRKAPSSSPGAQSTAVEARLRELLERKEVELKEREKQLEEREREGRERERDREREWQRTVVTLRHEQQAAVRDEKDRHARYKREVWDVLAALLKEKARIERAEADRQLLTQQYKIGRMVTRREGMGLVDCWEEGEKVRLLREQMTKLYRDHEQLVEHNKRAKRRHTNIKARTKKPIDEQKDNSSLSTSASSTATSLSASFDDGFARPAPVDLSDRYETNDTYTLRIDELRAEMTACQQRLDKYERQKKQIIRLTKLHADEQTSRFRCGTILHAGQYVITELLGKGGFSEVFKAWDCEGMRWVAVKVHQLNSSWPTERKNNYVRHATREYNIHQQLQHKHVVRLLDSFALTQQPNETAADTDERKDATGGGTDADGFVTVLEYCNEHDLDYLLKLRGTLSEKHARVIIAQVFSALAYFSSHASPHRIIHYDLKPGNILFHQGQVRVTDFGLSKILHSNSTDSSAASCMELTSQGAGTYWYLPPECFPDNSGDITVSAGGGSGGAGPMISSKVDIFSAGVILYQMLTGKKPFGHGQSPAALLHASIMKRANGRLLEWPAGCGVSEVTREFVQRCLSARPEDRPPIERIFDDPFFQKDAFTQKRKATAEAVR